MGKVVPTIIAAFAIILTLVLAISFIPFGHVAVVTHMGAIDEDERVRTEGLNFKVPFRDGFEIRSIQTIKYPNVGSEEIPAISSTSRDQQIVNTQAVVLYSLNPETLPKLLKSVAAYESTLIKPQSESAIKGVMGKFDSYDMVNNRQSVEKAITDELKERLANAEKCKNCINVESVQLINIDFSDQYDKAIEDKNEAVQKLGKAKTELEISRVSAEQAVVKAKGDADSIKIVDEALKNSPNYLKWKTLDKWDGKNPKVVGGGNVGVIVSTENDP